MVMNVSVVQLVNVNDPKGTKTYSDGSKYVGGWKDGKYNGQGTVTFPDDFAKKQEQN